MKLKFTNILVSAVLLLLGGATIFAQGRYEVKGTVVDALGPIIGATVIEQGTTNGASTDFDGNYVLTVSSADAVVEFSCIGYASQQFKASQVPATVTLSEDTQFLDDVVVIGYGTMKKSDLTGSVASVKTESLTDIPAKSIDGLLQGRVAGVQVINN